MVDMLHIQINKTGHYIIQKNINGKQIHCGTYHTLEEAIKVRDQLIDNDWDVDFINSLKHSSKGVDRYIYKDKCGFVIHKSINGKLKYFGRYRSRENARKERDLLEEYGWDEDLLMECE